MSASIKRKRTAFPLDYKLRIVEEAKLCNNNRQIARKHGLDEASVRNWLKNEMKLRNALSTGKMFRLGGGGRKPE